MKLTLYGTQDCHLCEQAADLLKQVDQPFDLDYVDIADSAETDVLMEKYGTRIPVIKNAIDRELAWPFDLTSLEEFLREKSI